MALTQEQVDAWFDANPNATAEEVAAAVQSVGGLEANAGLASMIANRYAIAEPEVTNYYNAYTAPKVDAPVIQNLPTFTDTILAGTPTTEDELLTALSDNTSTVTGATGADTVVGATGADTVVGAAGNDTVVGATGNDTVVGGTGTVTDPFDAITAAWTNGDYAATNAIIAESGLSADDIQSYYNLDDYTMDWVLRQGITTADQVSTVTGATGNDTVVGATGNDTVTAADTVVGAAGNDTVVGAAADNITSTGGYTKSATAATSGGVSNVIEGDDIETQIAQLPQEYASWQASVVPGYSDFIRKSDGVVLQRTKNNTFSDLDLLKIGLSFIPGAGPILAGLNIADAARTGNWMQAAIGATGFVPGMQNVNTALRVGQAVDSGNGLGAITALAGNTDVQNLLGLGNVNVGGFTAKDAMTAAQLGSAALAGNTAGVLTSLGTLAGSSDTVLAGRALGLITRIQNGDTRALGEAVNLSNSIAGGGTTGTTGTTGSTTVGNFEDTEVTRLRGLGYTNQQIQDYFNNLENLTDILDTPVSTVVGAAGNDVTLPGGVQLASTGDGVFRTDVGGVPTYAESANASSVTAPFGYTLLSTSEVDNKPEGAYYDITANAWFKPDTAATDLTGNATIQADADLFNSSLGTLDQLDANLTANDFEDFLRTIGITNATQLSDSGLSNQDILDMINALDDTVTVTGATGNDTLTGATTNDTITGANGNDNLETVTVTGAKGNDTVTGIDTITGGGGNDDVPTITVEDCKDGKVRDPVSGLCVLPTKAGLDCPPGFVPNEAGTECIPEVTIEECKDGKVRDPITGQCVLPELVIEECKDGKVRDPITGQCVLPELVIEDCKDGKVRDPITGLCVLPEVVIEDCKDGKVRDPVTGLCVLPTQTLDCPAGYEPNEAGTECIPVVTITDKKCPPGQVYDEDLKMCVAIKEEPCPEGFERDEATGKCIPVVTIVDKKCPTGQVYDEELKKCVPIKEDKCPEGFERDEITGKCIPVLVIDDKKCPVGSVYDEELKKCVPVEDDKCETGYEKVNGTCVPVCKEGYLRNLETGVCEKEEKGCPPGQTKNAEGKCVSIVKPPPPPPPPIQCPTGFKLVNGACVPISTTTPIYTPSSAAGSGEKNEPIYAGGMDAFNLLATLQELLAEEAPKKDDKKSKDKTKMATGGHLDDLLAEQMTVDDLLKLLR